MSSLQHLLARLRRLSPPAWDLFAIMVFAAALLPRSFMEVAAKIGYEMHVVSFLIGPASYAFGDGLVPGRDYFTQYSLGMPFLFSWVLDGNADHAVLSYVKLMVFAMLLFYCGLYFLLRWLYGSRAWALITSVTILILQFHVERTFFDPSSYVLRYPLLVIVLALLGAWAKKFESFYQAFLLSGSLALSLFLNTETGLYLCIAVSTVGFFLTGGSPKQIGVLVGMLIGSLAVYAALCRVTFGPGVFSSEFVEGWFEPFLIYGGGFGGWAIDWVWGWHLFYNILAPGIALTTAAWGAHRLWTGQPAEGSRPLIAVLVASGLTGILMSAKYSNMSIVALWHVNAIGFFIVMGWWGRQIQLAGQNKIISLGPVSVRAASATGAVAVLLAIMLLASANDQRNPALYAFNAWLRYPSLANPLASRYAPACKRLDCAAPRLHPVDVRLIQTYVAAGKRAAVFGWNDWAYLIEAQRASWFHFLPSQATFTRHQLDAVRKLPPIMFLPVKKDDGNALIGHPELNEVIEPHLLRDYKIVVTGQDLAVWRKSTDDGTPVSK